MTPEYHASNRNGLPLEAQASYTVPSGTESRPGIHDKRSRNDPARSFGLQIDLHTLRATDLSVHSFFLQSQTAALIATRTRFFSTRQHAKLYALTPLPDCPRHFSCAYIRSSHVLKYLSSHPKIIFHSAPENKAGAYDLRVALYSPSDLTQTLHDTCRIQI